jgi:hypothetical protein
LDAPSSNAVEHLRRVLLERGVAVASESDAIVFRDPEGVRWRYQFGGENFPQVL